MLLIFDAAEKVLLQQKNKCGIIKLSSERIFDLGGW